MICEASAAMITVFLMDLCSEFKVTSVGSCYIVKNSAGLPPCHTSGSGTTPREPPSHPRSFGERSKQVHGPSGNKG